MPEEFNLPKIEEKILKFWEKNQIFEKTLQARQGSKKFVFYEGPPYANGKPGIHHVLARVFKDIILRYKSMRGYYVPRRAGWDTHGLPVEMAAEKALGFKSKKDIEKYGVKLFNQKAKEQVWIYKDEWESMTRRIGYWLDLKNAYVTYEPEYIETLWWTMSQIWKRKLLYKGHKVVPWCTRCGTALSSHELAQGYKETTDQSIYVKFRLLPHQKIGDWFTTDESVYVLSWTTTPWTLPGNVALAVNEKIDYAILKKMVNGKIERWIVAKNLAANFGPASDIREIVKGKELIGLSYESLFKIPELATPTAYKIYPANFVTIEDGTGIVHTAVMYGEDDYALGKKVDLPQRHTVSEDGKFERIVPGLAGLYAKSKEADEKIFEHLHGRGNLLRIEPYVHEYPYCWRCGTAVLYYARTSWFIAMSKLREKLLAANKKINWIPAHLQKGRFGEWLREVKDWNLSRERYWGTPLPIWECKKCRSVEVIGGLDELSEKSGGARNNYWVMRHGESESNVFDLIDSGKGNLHLTPRGRAQAEASAKKLKQELGRAGKKIDMIFSSDITRTRETEKIASGILDIKKVTFDKRLQEIHLGVLDGCHDKKYHDMFPTYEARFEKKPEGGESLRDLRKRAWEFFAEVEKRHKGKNILIVSHEYPIWMFFHMARGWSEKKAIEEKNLRGKNFIELAQCENLGFKRIPRNDAGEADLHRPYVDGILVKCSKCNGEMRRVKEVADVWYDSGAMPFAQAHYPFAFAQVKSEKLKVKNLRKYISYPADYIAEGMDQTRGWFYTLLAVATAMGFEAPYKNVVSLGLINDKFGQKMSKSKGNIIDPLGVIEKYGVDAVRWYFYTVTPPGEQKNFDEAEVGKAYRKMHLILYNSLVFYKTYAAKAKRGSSSRNILDKWIISRLNETVFNATAYLEKYEIRDATLLIEEFIDDLSRWYIRRSRRRLQKPASQSDFKLASATLGFVLGETIKLLAPFTPFFAEFLHADFKVAESVHLENWPVAKKKLIDKKLSSAMGDVRRFASLGLAKRAELGIKVRQPLAELKIKNQKSKIKSNKELLAILAEEVNVKKIVFDSKIKEEVELDSRITPELREEGIMREIIRVAQDLRQKAGLKPGEKIILLAQFPAEIRIMLANKEPLLKKEIGAGAVEYKKSDKFDAEESTKVDDKEIWLAVRRI